MVITEYKCRRCGGIIKAHTDNISMLKWITLRLNQPTTHNCEDGGIGVADFIGGTEEG